MDGIGCCATHCTTGDGLKSVVFPRSTSAVICRSGVTSSTQIDRPCVATTRSLAVVGWANSWTDTVGSPVAPLIFVHATPRLIDAKHVNSVPRYKRFGFAMTSRWTRVEPTGKLFRSDFHVCP